MATVRSRWRSPGSTWHVVVRSRRPPKDTLLCVTRFPAGQRRLREVESVSRVSVLVGGDGALNPGVSGFEQCFQPGPSLCLCPLLCVALRAWDPCIFLGAQPCPVGVQLPTRGRSRGSADWPPAGLLPRGPWEGSSPIFTSAASGAGFRAVPVLPVSRPLSWEPCGSHGEAFADYRLLQLTCPGAVRAAGAAGAGTVDWQ